jgi:hypothetical protein
MSCKRIIRKSFLAEQVNREQRMVYATGIAPEAGFDGQTDNTFWTE